MTTTLRFGTNIRQITPDTLDEFQDISRTMLTAGHEGAPATMYQNYRGLATKANGHSYYKIKPRPVTNEAEPSAETQETKRTPSPHSPIVSNSFAKVRN